MRPGGGEHHELRDRRDHSPGHLQRGVWPLHAGFHADSIDDGLADVTNCDAVYGYAPRLKGDAQALYAGSTLIHQTVFSVLMMLALACAAGIGARSAGSGSVLWALAAWFVSSCCASSCAACVLPVYDRGRLFSRHSHRKRYKSVGCSCSAASACICRPSVLAYRFDCGLGFFLAPVQQALYQLRPRIRRRPKKNWPFRRWVFASGLVWTATTNLYPWLLAFFHGAAAAGVFAACLGVVSASNPALLGIQNLVGPEVAREFAGRGKRGCVDWC